MKLSNAVTELIGNRKLAGVRDFQSDLGKALVFTEYWVGKCIKENKDNGPLTLEKALQMIEAFTGLQRSEILVEENKEAKVA
jgi:hypothetical protein